MSIVSAMETLLRVVRQRMLPVLEPEQIELCSPDTVNGQTLLGIHLYSVTRDPNFRVIQSIPVGSSIQLTPPLCMSLSCMFTAYAGEKSSFLDDYRILEKVLQIFNNRPNLPVYSIYQPVHVPQTDINLLSPDVDEMSRIWQFSGISNKLSMYYNLSPVPVGALEETVVPRVDEAEMGGGLRNETDTSNPNTKAQ